MMPIWRNKALVLVPLADVDRFNARLAELFAAAGIRERITFDVRLKSGGRASHCWAGVPMTAEIERVIDQLATEFPGVDFRPAKQAKDDDRLKTDNVRIEEYQPNRVLQELRLERLQIEKR